MNTIKGLLLAACCCMLTCSIASAEDDFKLQDFGEQASQDLGTIDVDKLRSRVDVNETDIDELKNRVSQLEIDDAKLSSTQPIDYEQGFSPTPIETVVASAPMTIEPVQSQIVLQTASPAPAPIVMSPRTWSSGSSGGSNGNLRSVSSGQSTGNLRTASGQSNGNVRASSYSTSMLSAPVVVAVPVAAPMPRPVVRRQVVRVPVQKVTTYQPVQQNCPGGVCAVRGSAVRQRGLLGSILGR